MGRDPILTATPFQEHFIFLQKQKLSQRIIKRACNLTRQSWQKKITAIVIY